MNLIPYGTQSIDESDISAVTEALTSGFLTTGSKVAEFEAALCAVTGAKYAVAVSNGTAALHLAALATGLGAGDEVIVSPMTFAASANCVLYCGAKPVFADIDPDTLLMDIEDVKKKITPRTRAIIAVHYGGEVCDLEAYSQLAEEKGLMLIQDSAHALGSLAYGHKLGHYSGLQTWSFHPVKTITTGEGGAITTNDYELFCRLVRLRTHGITRDIDQHQHAGEGDWYYDMLNLGYNYRLTDIQCALGISQLKQLHHFQKRRSEIVSLYDDAFNSLPLMVQKSPPWSHATRHIYTVRLHEKERRREVFDALRSRNIGVNVHYIPVYWLSYYNQLGYPKGLCPIAEDAYERLITIPLYPSMSDESIAFVIACVKELCGRNQTTTL